MLLLPGPTLCRGPVEQVKQGRANRFGNQQSQQGHHPRMGESDLSEKQNEISYFTSSRIVVKFVKRDRSS